MSASVNTLSVKYVHTETFHNDRSAAHFLPYLLEHIQPGSVIDVGCGLGNWLKAFKQYGSTEVLGIDGPNVDRSKLVIAANEFLEHDLTKPLPFLKKYDLCLCLEVAEHLPENCADALIQSITSLADTILFSAALPMQGGQNHINEQSFSYWVKKFNANGFIVFDCFRGKTWENEQIDWWYRQNMFLVRRSAERQQPILDFYHPHAYKEVVHKLISFRDIAHQGKLPPYKAFKLFVKSIMKKYRN